jgi:hypothetical protein
MHGRGELVGAVRASAVVERSALIPVASLGPAPFGGPHSVTYPINELVGEPILHSDPKPGERLKKQDLERLRTESRRHLDTATFQHLSELVLEKKPRRRRREREIRAEDPAAAAYLRASAVAMDELGATLVVLPSS